MTLNHFSFMCVLYVREYILIHITKLLSLDIFSEDFFELIIDLTLLQHNLISNKQRDENGE